MTSPPLREEAPPLVPRAAVWHQAVLGWYDEHARDLPWRQVDVTPWGVLVSEAMLQQTPVARVLPAWEEWLTRWPTPTALAATSPGEAVRAWGRLGYPRRALRLHEAATIIRDRYAGAVPANVEALRALPGVGGYTAAAVTVFAYGQRRPVLDINVRRVLARAGAGRARPGMAPTRDERLLAETMLPNGALVGLAPRWSVAVMELGALVCTARAPRCGQCPLRPECAWVAAGQPMPASGRRRGQTWEGTDRQARGRLLAVLRESPDPVPIARLDAAWPVTAQRQRALDGLVADGLVEPVGPDLFALPS